MQEFGKDCGTYFSILSAIAAGKTEYSQIEDEIGNRLDFYEIKRDGSRIARGKLVEKAEAFFRKNPQLRERQLSFRGLSLEDM